MCSATWSGVSGGGAVAVGVTEEAFLLRLQGGKEGAVFGIGGGVDFGDVWCVGDGEVVEEVVAPIMELVAAETGSQSGRIVKLA